jgi:hypothetical protein
MIKRQMPSAIEALSNILLAIHSSQAFQSRAFSLERTGGHKGRPWLDDASNWNALA